MIKTKPDAQAFNGPSSTFHNGEGVSPYFVSCANNPMDLRPAVDIIMKRIADVLGKTDENTPTVVLMGDTHTVPAHVELQHLVAAQLLKMEQKFAFNFEMPNNFIETIAAKNLNKPFPRYLKSRASDYDLDGKAILSGFMGFHTLPSPAAHNDLFAFCYKNSIPFQFNDAARKSHLIDRYNKQNKEAKTKYSGPVKNFEIEDPDGMAVRNHVMVERALTHAEKVGTNLILQGCGINHIFGNYSDKSRYEDSLSALYKQAGAQVITVLPVTKLDNWGINMFPEAAYKDITQSIIIADMDGKYFVYGDEPNLELNHIHDLRMQSGSETSFIDVATKKEEYKNAATKHIDEITEKAKQDIPNQQPNLISLFVKAILSPFSSAAFSHTAEEPPPQPELHQECEQPHPE